MSDHYRDYLMSTEEEKLEMLGDIYRKTSCRLTRAIVLEASAEIYRKQKKKDSKETVMEVLK